MASNIIVLTPNGRRQNVKVTPNTTILQVLEEVCNKQGFEVNEYDVKHHNKILDVSSIIRFSGLPNNAQLEMCTIQKQREENPVILGLQLENGTRLTGSYIPNDNLWTIINQLCPDELSEEKNLVVIYMRQEMYGEEVLKNTSLKSLGLSGGRAMLRLIHRKPEELRTQANISAPLPTKPHEDKPEQPYVRKIQRIDSLAENNTTTTRNLSETQNEIKEHHACSPTPNPSQKKEINFITDFIKKEKVKKSCDTSKHKNSKNNERNNSKVEDITEDIAFLGERSALVFSLDMAQKVPHEELPDEFFELTIKDARKLLKDLKQKREQLEENPLQTSALRKLEENKKVLRTLHQHKRSVLRVQFPDRTVLQGSFKPLETIKDVKNFVRDYLEKPNNEFHLYTTPPKNILKPESTLLDADCVPSIVLHFSYDTPIKEGSIYLKKDLYSKFTSPSLASVAAAKSRGNERKLENTNENPSEESLEMEIDEYVPIKSNEDDDREGAGTSTSTNNRSEISSSSDKYSTSNEKVPKWFKPSK